MNASIIGVLLCVVGLYVTVCYFVFWPKRNVIIRILPNTTVQAEAFGIALEGQYNFRNFANVFAARMFNPTMRWRDPIVVMVEITEIRKSELGLVFHPREEWVASLYVARLTSRRLRYFARKRYCYMPESEIAALVGCPISNILTEDLKGSPK